MLSWCNMRWSRSGAAMAVAATAGFVWGCSGSPSEPPVADDAVTDESGADGTVDSGSTGAAPMQSPAGAAASAGRPTYHVPVPAELEPYSNFELGDLRLREHGSEWELQYTLPELLVGGHQELSFRGSASGTGALRLLGDAGQVTCQSLAAQMPGAMRQCDEVLNRVELDRDKLERSFADLPAEESAARWAVVARFSDDPIGVLTFPADAR